MSRGSDHFLKVISGVEGRGGGAWSQIKLNQIESDMKRKYNAGNIPLTGLAETIDEGCWNNTIVNNNNNNNNNKCDLIHILNWY